MASDPTFRSYKADQAKTYAKGRPGYPENIFKLIYEHHAKTGGKFGRILDVGCGPGTATMSLAEEFNEAIGIDPGVEMINTAREIGGKTKSGKDIRFEICPAEKCLNADGVEPGSVDMLTSAMAAHWFDMEVFWPQAAALLKPGGTIALWTFASHHCHPSTPNHAEIQRIAYRLEREDLAPYELKPNRVSRDMYDDLTLPWQISTPVPDLPESQFVRYEFNRDGVIPEGEKEFFSGSQEQTLEGVERSLETASLVTRWREANPDLAGTEQDCLKRAIRDWKAALGGKDGFIGGQGTVILLFKKRS